MLQRIERLILIALEDEIDRALRVVGNGNCFLDKGGDSEVYKVDGFVYKRYLHTRISTIEMEATPTISREQLELYVSTTNKAAELLYDEPLIVKSSRFRREVPISINPVLNMKWKGDKEGFGVTRSHYISGVKLSGDAEWEKSLGRISAQLNTMIGVEGIEISPYNTALVENNEAAVVTDLCTYVGRLKRDK